MAEFAEAAIQIERQLVADADRRQALRYDPVRLPLYPYLVDPTWVERFEARGHPVADLVDAAHRSRYRRARGIPDGVTVALHICRGNSARRGCARARSNPSRTRFGELPYDAFLVEWDDLGRDGGFEPVRYLRKGSTMVMGIVSTKTPVLEDEDDLSEDGVGCRFVGGMDRLRSARSAGSRA